MQAVRGGIEAGIAMYLLVALAIGVWFFSANRIWVTHARQRHPDIFVDPELHPGWWIATAPERVRKGLTLLLNPSHDRDIEAWRVRTYRRWLLFLVFVFAGLLVMPVAGSLSAVLVVTMLARHPAPFGAAMAGVPVVVLAYWLYRLALAGRDYGNGQDVPQARVLVNLFGVLSALVIFGVLVALPAP